MKKLLALMLTAALALSLAACDAKEPDGSSAERGESTQHRPETPGVTQDDKTPPEEAPQAETVVRLLCLEDGYLAVAVLNCPNTDYGMEICDASGAPLAVYMMNRYTGMTMADGLWLADTESPVDGLSVDDLAVRLTAQDGTQTLYTQITPITPEEMATFGLRDINGTAVFAACGKPYVTSSKVEFNVVVYRFCSGGIDTLENAADCFRFCAADGTPLEEKIPNCTLEVRVSAPYVNGYFSAPGDTKALAEQLTNCGLYLAYTGADGSTWTLSLVE